MDPHPRKPFNPWLLLFGRTAFFIFFQACFALIFALMGQHDAWERGAACWPFTVTLANLTCVAIMEGSLRQEGKRFWHIFRIQRGHIPQDLLILLLSMIPMGPISYLPNVLLAGWLLGGAQAAVDHMLLPLPQWAAYTAILLFPLTQGLAEIPTYFAYIMPRLEAGGLKRWLAVSLPALMLGLQHAAVPLLFDVRFIAWRSLMFLPFAFMVALLLRWRPRLLPYLAIIHVLIDVSFAVMLLNSAY